MIFPSSRFFGCAANAQCACLHLGSTSVGPVVLGRQEKLTETHWLCPLLGLSSKILLLWPSSIVFFLGVGFTSNSLDYQLEHRVKSQLLHSPWQTLIQQGGISIAERSRKIRIAKGSYLSLIHLVRVVSMELWGLKRQAWSMSKSLFINKSTQEGNSWKKQWDQRRILFSYFILSPSLPLSAPGFGFWLNLKRILLVAQVCVIITLGGATYSLVKVEL